MLGGHCNGGPHQDLNIFIAGISLVRSDAPPTALAWHDGELGFVGCWVLLMSFRSDKVGRFCCCCCWFAWPVVFKIVWATFREGRSLKSRVSGIPFGNTVPVSYYERRYNLLLYFPKGVCRQKWRASSVFCSLPINTVSCGRINNSCLTFKNYFLLPPKKHENIAWHYFW